VENILYVIPTNIARFQVRYLLGLSADNLIAGVVAMVLGTMLHPLVGLALAPVGILLTRPFEALGDMHVFAYLVRWLAARVSPQRYDVPVVHSLRDLTVQILDEEAEDVLYVLGREDL